MIQKHLDLFITGRINKTSVKRGDPNLMTQDKTYDKRKIAKNSKSSKNLFKKSKNSIKRDEKSTTSKKVFLTIFHSHLGRCINERQLNSNREMV